MPQQVEIASHIYRLDTAAQQERITVLCRTHGCLDEADAKAFQEALDDSRRIETHD